MLWLFVYGHQFHSATLLKTKFWWCIWFEIHIILLEYIGDLGLILLLLFVLFSFIILNFNINFKNFLEGLKKKQLIMMKKLLLMKKILKMSVLIKI